MVLIFDHSDILIYIYHQIKNIMQKFIGGIGCFWDETKYEGIAGIISTECGYCGGKSPQVSYEQVCGGNTEHVEVVKVEFDPKIISYEDVTRLFFKFHDPTTLNRQGPNVGHQYRSEIFYATDEEKNIAERVLNEINKKLDGKVVTKISKIKNYVVAESYHQDYFKKKH
jgi:methionine-S-sulfoxide reductase